jgi:hypothetical protein
MGECFNKLYHVLIYAIHSEREKYRYIWRTLGEKVPIVKIHILYDSIYEKILYSQHCKKKNILQRVEMEKTGLAE